MARKFITDKEFSLIDKINKELIQGFVGQEVIYYAISEEHTVAHRIYQESVEKIWYTPVKINARVDWDNPAVETNNFTLDSKYTMEVYFHKQELIERNVSPKEGDYIEFGQIVFEITSVTQPQLVFGQVNKKIMIKCVCVPSREGQFQIHGDSSRFVDNTHPVEDPECSNVQQEVFESTVVSMSLSVDNGEATLTDLSTGSGIHERIVDWGDGQISTGDGPWTHTYSVMGLPVTVTLTLKNIVGEVLGTASETIEWWQLSSNFQDAYDVLSIGEVFSTPVLAVSQSAKYYIDVPEGYSGLEPEYSVYGPGNQSKAQVRLRKDTPPTNDEYDKLDTLNPGTTVNPRMYWGSGRWYIMVTAIDSSFRSLDFEEIVLDEEGSEIPLNGDTVDVFSYNTHEGPRLVYPVDVPDVPSFTLIVTSTSGSTNAELFAPNSFARHGFYSIQENQEDSVIVSDPTPGRWYLAMGGSSWQSNEGTHNFEGNAHIEIEVVSIGNNAADLSGTVLFSSSLVPGFSTDSWSWNFGDGNTSTEQNPTHTYSATGSYTYSLTINESTLGQMTNSDSLVIPSGGDITYDATNAPEVSFSHESLYINTPQSWSWNFGDGNTSTEQNPTHTYAETGTYTVTLTITSAEGPIISKTAEITVVVVTTIAINDPVITNITVDEQKNYIVNVPAGMSVVAIQTSGGTGDIDVYAKWGSPPKTADYDYRSWNSGNTESITINNPQEGSLYIMLNPWSVGVLGSLEVTGS